MKTIRMSKRFQRQSGPWRYWQPDAHTRSASSRMYQVVKVTDMKKKLLVVVPFLAM